MADAKITALPDTGGLTDTDLFVTVDDVGGTPATTKVAASAVRTYASAASLALAGGTMSGALAMADNEITRPVLVDTSEKVEAVTFSATPTFDYASTSGTHKTMTLTDNITSITISNWPASGTLGSMTLFLLDDATGGRTLAGWPAAVDWGDDGAPPTGVANKLRIITLITTDGGTNIYGAWKSGHA